MRRLLNDCVDDIDNEMDVLNAKEAKQSGARRSGSSAGKVLVGVVDHFFDRISVAAIKLEGTLRVGDTIEIGDDEEAIRQKVSSMQIDRKDVSEASAGDSVGIQVSHPVHKGSRVYKVK